MTKNKIIEEMKGQMKQEKEYGIRGDAEFINVHTKIIERKRRKELNLF